MPIIQKMNVWLRRVLVVVGVLVLVVAVDTGNFVYYFLGMVVYGCWVQRKAIKHQVILYKDLIILEWNKGK